MFTNNGICRAWCVYNGSTQTILGSFNITSVTRNATGDYTFNMTNAMPSNVYGVYATNARGDQANPVAYLYNPVAPTSSSFRCLSVVNSNTVFDTDHFQVMVFSN